MSDSRPTKHQKLTHLPPDSTADLTTVLQSNAYATIPKLPLARIKKLIKYELDLYHNLYTKKHQPHSSSSSSTTAAVVADSGGNGTAHDTRDHTVTISSDCPYIFSKACEYLIYDLTVHAWQYTLQHSRRTLQRSDVHSAVYGCSRFDFLQEVVSSGGPIQLGAEHSDHEQSSASPETVTGQ